MHLQTRALSGPQKINIFSKSNPARVRLRLPYLLVVLFGIFVGVFAVWERIHYVRIGYDTALLKQENEKLEVERQWHKLTSGLYPADSAELLLQHLGRIATSYDLTVLERQLEFGPLLSKLGSNRSLGQIEAVSLEFSGRGRYLDVGEFPGQVDLGRLPVDPFPTDVSLVVDGSQKFHRFAMVDISLADRYHGERLFQASVVDVQVTNPGLNDVE